MKWYDPIIHLNMNVRHCDLYLSIFIFKCTSLKVVYRITLIVLVIGKAQFRPAMLSCDSSCCICENKDADQLCSNCEADQRLCFRYTDSTISHLPKYEISSLQPSSVAVQPGLCGTWSETRRAVFSQRGSYNGNPDCFEKGAWLLDLVNCP